MPANPSGRPPGNPSLLDITMPVVNGFAVLTWLKSHRRLPRVRPLMLSGSYRTGDINRAMALGAVDYLVKPITPRVLAALAAKQLVASVQT